MKKVKKKVLLVDMDGVLADFIGFFKDRGDSMFKQDPPEMYEVGFFENLKPLKGSHKAIRRLLQSGKYDVWICTQPVANSVSSYFEKAKWILSWFPELSQKIIMTQNKDMIDCDYLIDDNYKWARGCQGEFLHFDLKRDSGIVWEEITNYLTEN